MISNIEIGLRIKSAREDKNFTQGDIAKELGMNKSTIQRYETGGVEKIKLPVIEAIARYLDVNPAWLVGKTSDRCVISENPTKPINQSETERKVYTLVRYLEKIPEDKREKLLKSFEDIIDNYLDIMGIDKDK